MNIACRQYHLRFKHPFTISKGTKTHQPTFILRVEQDGICGYGEAPAISYYNIPLEKMQADVEAHQSFLEAYRLTTPDQFYEDVKNKLNHNSFALCALDMAVHDWYGKKQQQALYNLFQLDTAKNPLTDFTIGIDEIPVMLKKMEEQPWPVYKVKLGTAHDLEIITALRQHTRARIRVDANAAWSYEQALTLLPQLQALGVELVEQPLAKDNFDGMKKLKQLSPLPLFADESCVGLNDVVKCADAFHGINIKLTKCGGITPALRMIQQARQLNMKVMMGSMNESTIGTSAVAQMLPLLDEVDMDGPLLLAEDLAEGIQFDTGRIIYSQLPGLGMKLFEPF